MLVFIVSVCAGLISQMQQSALVLISLCVVGSQAMQLMVKRQVKQQWTALPNMPVDLEEVTTVWSDKIVKALGINLGRASVVAGAALPAIRSVWVSMHSRRMFTSLL